MFAIVVGMQTEASIVNNPQNCIVIQGKNADANIQNDLEQIILNNKIRGILCFGVSGGIFPGYMAGDIVVVDSATDNTNYYVTDKTWSNSVFTTLHDISGLSNKNVRLGHVAFSRNVVITEEDKLALHTKTMADIVDMESFLTLQVAAKYKIPCIIVRTISDPYNFSLPPAAVAAISSTGSIDVMAVIESLGENISQTPELLKLAEYANLAFSSLAWAITNLGINFAWPLTVD